MNTKRHLVAEVTFDLTIEAIGAGFESPADLRSTAIEFATAALGLVGEVSLDAEQLRRAFETDSNSLKLQTLALADLNEMGEASPIATSAVRWVVQTAIAIVMTECAKADAALQASRCQRARRIERLGE